MNVIGHQHVGVHYASIAISIVLNPFKVGHAVASVAKILRSVISPHDDTKPFKFDSRLARHHLLLSLGTPDKSITHA